MTTEKQDILIIDDDQDYCDFLGKLLSEDFNCHVASSGREGLYLFNSACKPIIVLVDLNLPDINGFDICKQLKKTQSDREFAIFVISGDDSTQTKINAFDVGADDFIAKPFEIKELKSRIARSILFVQGRNNLKEEGETTKQLANIAMAQASQYGYIMKLFQSLNHCQNPTEVISLFYEAMTFFDLSSSIMIDGPEPLYFDVSLSDISPIEKNFYDLLKAKGRLYEFGSRLMVNGNRASFLVKSLPNDLDKAGQARDFLAALIEGIDTKLADIDLKSGVLSAVAELNNTISHIKIGVMEQHTLLSSVMSDMLTDISASYHSLDLNEDQEKFFTDLVELGAKRMSGAEGLLKNVQTGLEDIKIRMEAIQTQPDAIDNPEEVTNDDIELF